MKEDHFRMNALLSQAEDLISVQKFEKGQQLVALVIESKTNVPPEVQDRADSILCQSYMDCGNYERALSLANQIVLRNRDLYPDVLAKAVLVRASILLLTGNHKECVEETSKIIDGPVKATMNVYLMALQTRATTRLVLEDKTSALEDYDELVSTVPRDNLGWLGTVLVCRAIVRWTVGKNSLAIQDAMEGAAKLSLVEEQRRHIGAPMQGFALAIQGEWLEAVPFFAQGIDNPHDVLIAQLAPYLRIMRAHCYEEGGDFASAISEYRALAEEQLGLEFFDAYFVVAYQLCTLTMRTGEPEAALAYCESALNMCCDGPMLRFQPFLRYHRALLCIKFDRFNEAREELHRLHQSVEEEPLKDLVGFWIATTHAAESDFKKALAVVEDLLENYRSPSVLHARCLAMRAILKHELGVEGVDATVDARKAAEMAVTEGLRSDPLREESDRLFDDPDAWTELFASASSDEERAKMWLFRARILFTSERWEETEECIERVIDSYTHCKREYLQALELLFHYYTVVGECNRVEEIQKQIREAEAIALFNPVKEIIASKFLG